MEQQKLTYNNQLIDFVPTGDTEVLVNATEMAKAFGKETRVFLKTEHAKAFIKVAEQGLNNAHSESERAPNGARSDIKLIDNRGHMGIYFHRLLALKFAAWLSPEFELWVYQTIDDILFGPYKAWRATEREKLQAEMRLQQERDTLIGQYPELRQFFELEASLKSATNKAAQTLKAAKNQFKIEFDN